jgi:hypothetical protein
MLELARSVGITLPLSRLIDVREIRGPPEDAERLEGKAFAVQRFDQGPGGQRIHMGVKRRADSQR